MSIGSCDCCERREVRLHRIWYCGIETFACAECLGDDPDAYEYSESKSATLDDIQNEVRSC